MRLFFIARGCSLSRSRERLEKLFVQLFHLAFKLETSSLVAFFSFGIRIGHRGERIIFSRREEAVVGLILPPLASLRVLFILYRCCCCCCRCCYTAKSCVETQTTDNNPLSSLPRSHKRNETKNKSAQKRAHAGKETPRRRKVVRALKKSFAFATSK